MNPQDLTPKRIVAELDRYIVGQASAKRAVAIALRNRYRRERLQGDMRDEVIPKNILMIGPTGVGKTEIARRLSTLVGATGDGSGGIVGRLVRDGENGAAGADGAHHVAAGCPESPRGGGSLPASLPGRRRCGIDRAAAAVHPALRSGDQRAARHD